MGHKVKRILPVLSAVLITIISVIFGGVGLTAYAAVFDTTQYTDVLDDLHKDVTFDMRNYPANATDYSIQVIQIAESTAGELFVYTYQPCQDSLPLIATDINMSLSESADGTQLYSLTLLNINAVFCKYIVNDFTVRTEPVRYYNITSIYRKWLSDIDDGTGNDNKIIAVSYEYGILWRAETVDSENVDYTYDYVDTVIVTDKYVGYCRYDDGYIFDINMSHVSFDSWYVAFSTEYDITQLYEVNIEYMQSEGYRYPALGSQWKYNDPVLMPPVLITNKTFESPSAGWFGGEKILRNRISSSVDFVAKESLKDNVKENVENKQWVIRFTETDYEDNLLTTSYCSKVSEVTILRLNFLMNGKVYNLGVVDNKQTGGNMPSNNPQVSLTWWQIALIVAAVLIVLSIVLKILSLLVPAIALILNGVWLVLSAPFRLIALIISKIRGGQ